MNLVKFNVTDLWIMYKISSFCITTSICVLFCTTFPDAVYTERYMGTPAENSDSYKVSDTQGR